MVSSLLCAEPVGTRVQSAELSGSCSSSPSGHTASQSERRPSVCQGGRSGGEAVPCGGILAIDSCFPPDDMHDLACPDPGEDRVLNQRDQTCCLSPSGSAPLVGGLSVLLCTVPPLWRVLSVPLLRELTRRFGLTLLSPCLSESCCPFSWLLTLRL